MLGIIRKWVILITLIFTTECATQPPIESDLIAVTISAPTQHQTVNTPISSTPTTTPESTCPNVISDDIRTPNNTQFIQLDTIGFYLNNTAFMIRGIHYEPRDYPQITITNFEDAEIIENELRLIYGAGFNMLYVVINPNTLISCDDNTLSKNTDAFDTFLSLANSFDFRVIIQFSGDMLANNYPQQIQHIVHDYQNEATILAWNMHTFSTTPDENEQTRLIEIYQQIRSTNPRHFITTTWPEDNAQSAPLVDFISIEHFNDVESLRQKIAVIQSETAKPILLTTIGYPTINGDEVQQRNQLYDALIAAENNQLLGWSIYTAFDPLDTSCTERSCQRYGLWNTSYFPKLALDVIDNIQNAP